MNYITSPLFKKSVKTFNYVYMYVSMCGFVPMRAGPEDVRIGNGIPYIQAVVSCLTLRLGTELWLTA